MLHKEIILTESFSILTDLQNENLLSGFRLVGGTPLALLIGHRKSEDVDLFSDAQQIQIKAIRNVEWNAVKEKIKSDVRNFIDEETDG